MQLQVDNEFQQVKIKDLTDKYNVTMFPTSIKGGKAFAAEQEIRERKSRIAKLKVIFDKNKAKTPPTTIIRQSAENMNDIKNEKYSISCNDIEKNHSLVNGFKHYSILKE